MFVNHCQPPQVSYGDDNDETLIVHALCPIKKGDELCISYIDEDAELKVRQEQLLDHYLFKCTCVKVCRTKRINKQRNSSGLCILACRHYNQVFK